MECRKRVFDDVKDPLMVMLGSYIMSIALEAEVSIDDLSLPMIEEVLKESIITVLENATIIRSYCRGLTITSKDIQYGWEIFCRKSGCSHIVELDNYSSKESNMSEEDSEIYSDYSDEKESSIDISLSEWEDSDDEDNDSSDQPQVFGESSETINFHDSLDNSNLFYLIIQQIIKSSKSISGFFTKDSVVLFEAAIRNHTMLSFKRKRESAFIQLGYLAFETMRPEKIKHTKLISPEDAANTLNDEYELNSALLNQLKRLINNLPEINADSNINVILSKCNDNKVLKMVISKLVDTINTQKCQLDEYSSSSEYNSNVSRLLYDNNDSPK